MLNARHVDDLLVIARVLGSRPDATCFPMLTRLRTYASFVRFSHSVFALPFAIVGALLIWEQSLVRADDLSQVARAFDVNGWVGIAYLVTTAVAVFVR